MIGEILGGISILGTATLGFLNWYKDKKKDEVDAETTDTVTSLSSDKQSVESALLLRDAALKDRKEMEERLDGQDAKIALLSATVEGVRAELHSTRTTWRNWAEDLHRRWDFHRQQDNPPVLPNDDGQEMDPT